MLFFTITSLFGQTGKEQFSDQTSIWDELDKNELTLIFSNALTGDPISDASVNISGIGDYKSDYEGRAHFPIPSEDGHYQVIFMKEGYIKTVFKIEIMAGTLFFNRFSISPTMPLEYLRVVLDWGENPRDLDAHIIKRGSYHISYRKMKVSDDRVTKLDRDDVDRYGPETITSNRIDENAVYNYFVHDYSNRRSSSSKKLSESKACIKIYGNNSLLRVFHIQREQIGTYWDVFKIENGAIIPVNVVSGDQPRN